MSLGSTQVPRHEDVQVSADTAPRIFNLDARWRSVVSVTARPVYPKRKSSQYPTERKLGGSQSWYLYKQVLTTTTTMMMMTTTTTTTLLSM
jgi:hypothetical protein